MKRPPKAPQIDDLFAGIELDRATTEILFNGHIDATPGGHYYHWEQLRHRPPPDGLSPEQWWLGVKLARRQGRRALPLSDTEGNSFTYILTDEAFSMLQEIDQERAGRISLPEDVFNPRDRNQYLVSGLMEEAISSSLLEGAEISRRNAKKLLRSEGTPRTEAELMVVDNYRTMQHIRRDLESPLTVETVLSIHRMVTAETLQNPRHAGRMRQPGEERVVVGDHIDPDSTHHQPPPAEELAERMDSLVSFANGAASEPDVHPVVRAIALHFYLAYLHPFVDGNGRTARALFYRSMLQQGYWLAKYISISRLLRQAPVQYGRAFLYTESDGADFTYFLLNQLSILHRSLNELWRGSETWRSSVTTWEWWEEYLGLGVLRQDWSR